MSKPTIGKKPAKSRRATGSAQALDELTRAVAALAACLQRGPCWGATGETAQQLNDAWNHIKKAREAQNNPVQRRENDHE